MSQSKPETAEIPRSKLARARRFGACMGASTGENRTTEYMIVCRACGTEVRHDLVDHRVFGFRAGCEYAAALEEKVNA